MRYRKTAAGVVYQKNEFFLVQKPHWNGWWNFVQGGVGQNETPLEALIRELREETGTDEFAEPVYTGLTVQVELSIEALAHYKNRKGYDGKEISYFAVEFLGDRNDIRLGDDLSDKLWCSERELFILIHDRQRQHVSPVLNFIKKNKMLL
jgi:putative (di)nucleoside polyphosphate hydrolase